MSRTPHVVDTNVILIADGKHSGVSAECISSCAQELNDITQKGKIVLDMGYEILKEYQNKLSCKDGQGTPGKAFLKWVVNNLATSTCCDFVPLDHHPARGYESFPDDNRLNRFDPSDRKFVATANAHPQKPPILQAADSKWVSWSPPLNDHGLEVRFVCPKDIRRFARGKQGP